MYPFSIGVLLDSFRTNWREALKLAAQTGVSGIQVYATKGELAPENMSHEAPPGILKCSERLRPADFCPLRRLWGMAFLTES